MSIILKWNGAEYRFVYFMLPPPFFPSYTILDRPGLTNTVLYVQRYIRIILRSGCIACGEVYLSLRTPSFAFFFSYSPYSFCPSSFGRLSCTCCSLTDLLSTVSARLRSGQLFFPDKTSRYILLAFSPFPCFLALSPFWLVFKIMIIEGYKRNIQKWLLVFLNNTIDEKFQYEIWWEFV